jgi:uncharacterized protein YgbK (DUF1537 family)
MKFSRSRGGRRDLEVIVVLADDFSGAAEIAGAALEHGLSAEVHVDQLLRSNCDVAVVDTDTRSLPAEQAAAAIAKVARQVPSGGCAWIFKKIDSVLRGPIVAELEALCRELAIPGCLLVNANPRKERIVVGGRLLVGGQPIDQTNFAHDPEHPARTASVLELLGSERSGQLQLVDSSHDFAVIEPPRAGGVRICVGNCSAGDDLRRYAQGASERWLPAGGAEFFEAILEVRGHTRCLATRARQALQSQRKTLLVRGTSLPPTPHAASETSSAAPNAIPTIVATANPQEAAREVCRALGMNHLVTLAPARSAEPAVPTKSAGRNAEADRLHAQLIGVVRQVASRCPPEQFWIEGGRTASSIVRALGWQRLLAEAVYADGVVGLRGDAAAAPLVVVKPGSYRWPDATKGT